MPFVWLLQHILARSAENAGVADVFVAHAVRIVFYGTTWTFDVNARKTDMPFVLVFTAHLGRLTWMRMLKPF